MVNESAAGDQYSLYMTAIDAITDIIRNISDRDELLKRILQTLCEILKLDKALVCSVCPDDNTIETYCEWPNEESGSNLQKFKYSSHFSDKHISQIIETHHYLISSQTASLNCDECDNLHDKFKVQCLLWYPFDFDGNSFNSLLLGQARKEHLWTKQELIFIGSVTKQLSLALLKLQLTDIHTAQTGRMQKLETESYVLNTSTNIFRSVMENSPIPIWISDEKGTLIHANDSLKTTLNLTDEQLVGKYNVIQDENFQTSEIKQKIEDLFERHNIVHHSLYWESRVVKHAPLNGARNVWIDLTMYPILDADKKIINIVCQWIDITEENRAKKKSSMLNKAIENSLNAFDIVDHRGRIIYANQAYCKMWGYDSIEEILDTSPVSHCEDPQKSTEIINEIKEKGKFIGEFKAKRKDGTSFDVLMYAFLDYDENGNEIYPGTSLDITDRKNAEIQMKDLLQEQEVLLNNDPSFIIYKDTENNIIKITDTVAKMTNLPKEEIEGKPSAEIFPTMADEYYRDDKEVMDSGNPKMGIIEPLPSSDGSRKWLLTNKVPVKAESGKVTGIIVFSTDITSLKKAQDALEDSEKKYRLLVDNINDLICEIDSNGVYTYLNKNYKDILGYEPEELLGKPAIDLIHPDDLETSLEKYEKVKDEAGVSIDVWRFLHKDGSYRIIESKGQVYQYSEDELRTVIISRDITEQKKTQEQLQKIQWLLTPKSKTQIDDKYSQPYGDLTELNSDRTILDSVGEEMLKDIVNDYLGLLETSAAVYEKNGDYAFGIFSSGWCRLLDRRARELTAITDLNESLDSGKWLCHESCWTDTSLKSIKTGKPTDSHCHGGLRIYAYPIFAFNEVVGSINFGYGNPPDKMTELREISEKYSIPIETLEEEARAYKTRPSYIIELAKERLQVSARVIGSLVELNVTKRQLQESRDFLSRTGEMARVGGWDLNVGSDKVYWTETTCRIHELPDDFSPTLEEAILFYHPEDRSLVQESVESAISKGTPFDFEARLITAKGKEVCVRAMGQPIMENGKCIKISGTFQDITEQKKLESALEVSSRLESLGVLAGGIAHDFNNLLSGFYGLTDLALQSPTVEKKNYYLGKAGDTIERSRSLTQQLLTFAKGGSPVQKIAPLFPMVEESVHFALSGSKVSCNFDVPQDLWNCNYDENQISQVIDNLIINSKQAIPNEGKINVTARNISIAEGKHPLLAEGDYVRISIKDNGIGIPKEKLDKIFDPFFTTKAYGHGLGLATCYSIVKKHGGCIEVDSELHKGSLFNVYLPAVDVNVPCSDRKLKTEHFGSGTFLVMDDEEVIREILKRTLESFGYTVVCKENGRDALDFLEAEFKTGRSISAMIFDLTVPGAMGGKETIAELRKTNTKIPAFVASGYADGPVMKNPREYGFTASICKPFRQEELIDLLNNHLQTK
ncbi:PAS domain S-box protein [Spirochaeta isovalerica]|uniref:histidine kinase n=1 Tax=Spirochaeta isovalerica TaxID=150 RepID=A0A841RBY2_9SPIO|nr:PAS domain S-box protein [Spirochaeta isovalerica]MBB6479912.1 PAS domain S-box-containing protein [Spirochaeta isovalerica]